MTTLYHYFSRLEDTLNSRQELDIQEINIVQYKPENNVGEFHARASFYDASLLEAVEKVSLDDGEIIKDQYSYHYQEANGDLVACVVNRQGLLCFPDLRAVRAQLKGS